jgi:RNA polymerase sigma-70 factor (ECF subfamily)
MKNQEQNIIQKLKNGEESGLRQMFDTYYSPLCIFALKYIDSFDLAEDLVQDVFIQFWEKKRIDQLRGSLKSYLFSAIRNNALNYIRQNNKFRIQELYDEFDILMEDTPDKEDLEVKKQKLYKELDALPAQARLVFEAIIFNDKRYKEVAEELDISLNTVKTHFSRALKQLRSSLDVIIMIMLP